MELGVEGSEQFVTDTALVDELSIAAEFEVIRELPGVATLYISNCSVTYSVNGDANSAARIAGSWSFVRKSGGFARDRMDHQEKG